MGCASSTNTVVRPLTPEEVKKDEDETGSKLDGRGDSAVSKGTTDSGVVMDNREISDLPGAVPNKLPPLTSVRESETDQVTQDGMLQQENAAQERQNSSEILEELLLQGIIPAGQSRETSSGAGEAYSIMLSDSERVTRRPPARLESLRTKSLPSREEIEEKIRLADERRKSKEEELKKRLRSKSARVRGPAPTFTTEHNTDFTPVETLQSPITPDPQSPPPHSQIPREAAEGGEMVREAAGDGRESKRDTKRTESRQGKEEGGGEEDGGDEKGRGENGDGEEEKEEELTKVEELLISSEELECDTSFQQMDKIF